MCVWPTLAANRLGNDGGALLPPSIASLTQLQKLCLRGASPPRSRLHFKAIYRETQPFAGNDFNEQTCCLVRAFPRERRPYDRRGAGQGAVFLHPQRAFSNVWPAPPPR